MKTLNDAFVRRISRWMNNIYAVSTKDIAKKFDLSYRQAQRYVSRMKRNGIIYNRYRYKYMYYSLTKYRRS